MERLGILDRSPGIAMGWEIVFGCGLYWGNVLKHRCGTGMREERGLYDFRGDEGSGSEDGG